jgi:hypothetical protein
MTNYKTFEIESTSGLFQIRNYGGNTYNVFLEGKEIDAFTYYGDKKNEEFICQDYVQDFEADLGWTPIDSLLEDFYF